MPDIARGVDKKGYPEIRSFLVRSSFHRACLPSFPLHVSPFLDPQERAVHIRLSTLSNRATSLSCNGALEGPIAQRTLACLLPDLTPSFCRQQAKPSRGGKGKGKGWKGLKGWSFRSLTCSDAR